MILSQVIVCIVIVLGMVYQPCLGALAWKVFARFDMGDLIATSSEICTVGCVALSSTVVAMYWLTHAHVKCCRPLPFAGFREGERNKATW